MLSSGAPVVRAGRLPECVAKRLYGCGWCGAIRLVDSNDMVGLL